MAEPALVPDYRGRDRVCRTQRLDRTRLFGGGFFFLLPGILNISSENWYLPQRICETIKYIVDHRDKITEWGQKGRQFVENYHDSIKIAQEYIKLWESER